MRTNRAARSLSGHQFVVKEVEEVRAPGAVAAGALTRGGFTRGRLHSRAASENGGGNGGNGGNGGVATEEDKNIYRLSDLPGDVNPAVSVAQGFRATSRGLQSRQMAVVEIASTIAGVVMTRVLDNQGDVSWELDQMPKDAIHPGGASTTPGSGIWQTQTITLPGLRCENKLGQETYADFEVNFKYNGSSVGFIEVSTTKAQDAWGWGLTVKENITSDPNTYDTVPPSGQRFAAVKLRFHFRFDHSPLQDVIGLIDLTLYGNGTFAESARWTQP
jgi:hypothetical protein